jgi:hypothetical protein
MIGRNDSIGRISTLEVRCHCGGSFGNVNMYLQHKRVCSFYSDEEYDSSQRMDGNSLDRATSSSSIPDFVLAVSPSEARATRLQCPCGRSFANDKALDQHIQCSKIHQASNSGSASKSKATAPASVPSVAPHSPPASILTVSGPLPGWIPSSELVPDPFLTYTYGYAFETQRILDLQKYDSLYYKQHVDQPPTRNENRDDSLVSLFESLNIQPQARPSVARFSCKCGSIFPNQNALEHHKREIAQLSLRKMEERKEKPFTTPRPSYQVDQDLRDLATIIARQ